MSDSSHLQLIQILRERWGFSACEWIALPQPLTLPQYDQWLQSEFQGDMLYLKRHREIKADPTQLLPNARSLIAISHRYDNLPRPHGKFPGLRVAAYARNEDYHGWLQALLEEVIVFLRSHYPEHQFLAATDAKPVLERDLAAQAGLGWIGKNTCLIDRTHGSFTFLAEILTTIPVAKRATLVHDFCGKCNRCIEACPTQAIEAPRRLNATRCISYLTIEAKGVPATDLRRSIGDWFFGCDICQSVCPWNKTVILPEPEPEPNPVTLEDLRWFLRSTEAEIKKGIRGTALERAKPWGLKRNAIIVAANQGLRELRPEITLCCKIEGLQELASWALQRLDAITPS